MRGWEKTNFYFTWLSSPSICRTNLYNRIVFSNLKRALGIVVEVFTPSREGRGTKVLVFKASLMYIVSYVKTLSQKRHQKTPTTKQTVWWRSFYWTFSIFCFTSHRMVSSSLEPGSSEHLGFSRIILGSHRNRLRCLHCPDNSKLHFQGSCFHRNSYEIRNTV